MEISTRPVSSAAGLTSSDAALDREVATLLLPTASWGAYPGNTLGAVGSGIGIVHNTYLFDKPQKTVVRAPFAPFPRSLGDERTLLPVPPWFVSHRRAAIVGRRIFAFAAKPSPLRLASTALAAMRP